MESITGRRSPKAPICFCQTLLTIWSHHFNTATIILIKFGKLSTLIVEAILICDESFRPLTPFEFARKPRGLCELKRWKVTEFRQFLLYSDPVSLKKILPEILYRHFLLFHVAIKILFNPDFCVWFNDYAGDPLVYLFRCRENSMVQNFPFINNCIYVIAIFKCYLIELFRFRRPFIRCCARTI